MATILVTGANRGIGLALCEALVGRGDAVVAACREASDALRALDVRIEEGVDVTDDASVSRLADALGGVSLDALILNAGVLRRDSFTALDYDGIRAQFEVNTLGPLRMASALRPRLPRGAKIVIVTSRMGSIADNTSGGYYGYRASKAAVNMVGASLAVDLAPDVAVGLVHPGYVKTDMTGGNGAIAPAEAAAGIVARLDELDASNTGSFWHQNGEALPW